MASGIWRRYKDPKTVKKDAMLGGDWYIAGEVTAMGALGAKAGKRAAQALGAIPGVRRPKKKKKMKGMEAVPKTRGKRVYPTGKGR